MTSDSETSRITELHVRMDCNGCVHKIKKTLSGIDGKNSDPSKQKRYSFFGFPPVNCRVLHLPLTASFNVGAASRSAFLLPLDTHCNNNGDEVHTHTTQRTLLPAGRAHTTDGCSGKSSPGEVVVQQVKESGVTVRYPMLAENNYGAWAMKMKIFMRAQGVRAAVESKKPVDERLDQMALAAIVQAVPEAVMMGVANQAETAKEVWDALEEMHVGEERVKKSRVQTLKREFDRMYMGESEKVSEFALKVTTIVNEMRALGKKVEDESVVEKLLCAVPDRFLPIVSTIEQWGDVSTMTVVEVIGRLRAFEESSRGQRGDRDMEKLLVAQAEQRLTRAEWEALVAEEKRNGEASGSGVNKVVCASA